MSGSQALVCGFADEASQVAGLAWALPGDSGGLIAREGATGGAEAQIEDAGESVKVALDAGELSCDAELSPRAAVKTLTGPDGEQATSAPEAAICSAKVNVAGAGSIECSGYLVRWAASPTDGAELLRQLAIPAADGSLILLASLRAPNGDGHALEATAAWLLDAEGGAAPFTEALLSTQYDGSGRQTRAGLELWPSDPDAPPMRAAGTVSEGQLTDGERVSAALLHTSAEGTEGLGGYVIWRAGG
jgi:hypothetical protein